MGIGNVYGPVAPQRSKSSRVSVSQAMRPSRTAHGEAKKGAMMEPTYSPGVPGLVWWSDFNLEVTRI